MKFESFPISSEAYLIGYFIALGLSLSTTLALIKIPFNQPSKGNNVKSFGGVPVVFSFLVTLWLLQLSGVIDSGHISLLTIITLSTVAMMFLGILDDYSFT